MSYVSFFLRHWYIPTKGIRVGAGEKAAVVLILLGESLYLRLGALRYVIWMWREDGFQMGVLLQDVPMIGQYFLNFLMFRVKGGNKSP